MERGRLLTARRSFDYISVVTLREDHTHRSVTLRVLTSTSFQVSKSLLLGKLGIELGFHFIEIVIKKSVSRNVEAQVKSDFREARYSHLLSHPPFPNHHDLMT